MGRLSRKVIVNRLDFYSFLLCTLYIKPTKGAAMSMYKSRKGLIVHDAYLNIME